MLPQCRCQGEGGRFGGSPSSLPTHSTAHIIYGIFLCSNVRTRLFIIISEMPYSMNGSENAAGAKFSWYNLISLDENRPTKKTYQKQELRRSKPSTFLSFLIYLFIFYGIYLVISRNTDHTYSSSKNISRHAKQLRGRQLQHALVHMWSWHAAFNLTPMARHKFFRHVYREKKGSGIRL